MNIFIIHLIHINIIYINILWKLLAKRRTSKGPISCQPLFVELIPLFRVQIHLLNFLHSSKCLHVDNFNPSEPQTFSETCLWPPLLWKFILLNPGFSESRSDLFFLSRAALTRLGWAWPGGLLSAMHPWRSSLLTLSVFSCSSVYTHIYNPPISKWSQLRGSSRSTAGLLIWLVNSKWKMKWSSELIKLHTNTLASIWRNDNTLHKNRKPRRCELSDNSDQRYQTLISFSESWPV